MSLLLRSACLCAAGVLSIPSIATADDFRGEVVAAYDSFELDGPGSPEVDTFGIGGTYYFAPVNTDGVPLAEAPFLRRASYVDAAFARADFGDAEFDVLNANVGYYFPDSIFFGRIGVTHIDDAPGDSTNLNASLGVAPIDGLLVTTDFDEDGWDPNVTARLVSQLPNSHFYAGSISIVDPDGGDTTFGIDFDYFLDNFTSIGVGYEDAGETVELRGEKFFSRNWAAGVSIRTADGGDGFGVHLVWRP